MPIQTLKKIINKATGRNHIIQLLDRMNQLENSHITLKQGLDYKLQDISNSQIIHALKLRLQLQTYFERDNNTRWQDNSDYQPAIPKSFADYLDDLRSLSPEVFSVWSACFEHGKTSYYDDRESSCSTWSNVYVHAFHSFVSLHAAGRLLDQGCGIYGLPVYLTGYPQALISAIEPLDPCVESDFEIVKGFSEFLPWPDNSFSTIVNGTSLDHVICLDTALNETHRVLRPDGKFLVWIASIQGAKPSDPSHRPVTPIDKFHLFHFHEGWFEQLMHSKFTVVEKLVFPTPSFDHIFYAFQKK